jgi:hypothetical protein
MDEEHRTVVDEDERAPEPLSPGEGAIAGLPGATYVSRALSPAFAYRLARNVRPFNMNLWNYYLLHIFCNYYRFI